MQFRHADREVLKLLQEEFISLPSVLLAELAAGAILTIAGENSAL